MIPEKVIKTVMTVIPNLSKDRVIGKLKRSIHINRIAAEDTPIYKFCAAIQSLNLQSIGDRSALIESVATKSGLPRGYVTTRLNQSDVSLPEHLSSYTRKTRSVVVAGVKAAENRKNHKTSVLSIEKSLRRRLEEYAKGHNKSVRIIAERVLTDFLDMTDKTKKKADREKA